MTIGIASFEAAQPTRVMRFVPHRILRGLMPIISINDAAPRWEYTSLILARLEISDAMHRSLTKNTLNQSLVILLLMTLWLKPGCVSAQALHALVIGNGAYQDSPLRNPVNDAHDIANTLETFGFSVDLMTDADQRTMETAVSRFTRSLIGGGGVGLFYFAGHGIEYNGRNYLIPIGAGIKDALDLKYKAVDAGYVLDGMEEAGNGLNLVVLDACRNNPYPSVSRSVGRGLARMNPSRGTLILYATQPGAVASDGPDRNGLFTKHLLAAMQTPGLEIEQVFKRTAVAVDRETGGAQTPWSEGVVLGSFQFRDSTLGADAPSPVNVQAPPPPAPAPIQVPVGHLQVNVNRAARVELDGRYVGDAQPGNPLNLSDIAVGEHQLSVTADGAKSKESRPSIHTNEWTQEVIALAPPAATIPPAPPPQVRMSRGNGDYWAAYSTVSGPSFRCSAATQPVEVLICRDPRLRQADGIMGEMYRSLRSRLTKVEADQVRAAQRAWISRRDRSCPVSRDELNSSAQSSRVGACLLEQIDMRNQQLWAALRPLTGQ